MTGRTRTHDGKTYTLSAAHPAADLFPWLEGDELQALADDIKANGQRAPIIMHKGVIADGRNREFACLVAGVKPKYQPAPGDTSEEQLVRNITSANLKRRHLSASQRAMIAAGLANLSSGRPNSAPVQNNVSQSAAAAQLNVSPRSVASAVKVKREAPELVEPVRNGAIDVKTAARLAEYPAEVRREVVESDDPKATADELLTDLGDDPEPMDDTLPEPSIDAGKPASPWRKRVNPGGSQVDPNHPFAALLHKFSAWSGEITKILKASDVGKELLWTLAELAKLKAKTRFVLFTPGESEIDNGSLRATTGRFVGFYALRQIVKLVGKRGKRLTPKMIQKTFLEALNASEADMLDSEVWE